MSFRPLSRIAAVALALGLASPAFAQFGPQGPPAVGVVTAEQHPVTESVEFVGRVEAIDRVELRARVTGFLQERVFTEGQEVAVSDVLFRMERPPFETEVARQRANLAAPGLAQASAAGRHGGGRRPRGCGCRGPVGCCGSRCAPAHVARSAWPDLHRRHQLRAHP